MAVIDISLLLHFLVLLALLFFQRRSLQRLLKHFWVTWQQHRPRRWKPQPPHDCLHCQAGANLQIVHSKTDIRPYSQHKSRRGPKKKVPTCGFACPNTHCHYHGVTDDSLHAIVG